MTNERYIFLSLSNVEPLTWTEIDEGWHFCTEFDGLLVGPGMTELEFCQCLRKDHPVYKTTPVRMDAPLDASDLGLPPHEFYELLEYFSQTTRTVKATDKPMRRATERTNYETAG